MKIPVYPPQQGDVWVTKDGREYIFFGQPYNNEWHASELPDRKNHAYFIAIMFIDGTLTPVRKGDVW